MNLTEEAKKIINDSEYQAELTEMIEQANQLLEANGIVPTDLQWTVLINHINEMIKRSKAGEKMTGIDPELFAEVSSEALSIAGELVKSIGNLMIDEMYVLSIHFETAKQNSVE
ncbi:PRD domain-containing protein [Enterococcus sp. BWB1-3]|uniref:PRD domain-containing protein n=1 Tax=unclassified Enterococcus TaxID=2608891 RepID=UPI001922EE57|nr:MULTISPECIES: PRD domain-containing protein [unclassified Enterococcus]MBL1227679.1 PRD domain-containing protein [Enterococcus sp. BWB1-3]MCB5952134.1 PRD domain-containing protein [Enterococcus sp. BWT-B8]MCB5954459.1 PRD domain-containing protein [Enterococcus sp. CWB-B31]